MNHACRLKKQELTSLAKSAEVVLRTMEESVKRELCCSPQASLQAVTGQPSKSSCGRAKIVISIQDKDGPKQFRVYKVFMVELSVICCLVVFYSVDCFWNFHMLWYDKIIHENPNKNGKSSILASNYCA